MVIRIGSAKFCVGKMPGYVVADYTWIGRITFNIRYAGYNTRAMSLLIGVHHITLRWRIQHELRAYMEIIRWTNLQL